MRITTLFTICSLMLLFGSAAAILSETGELVPVAPPADQELVYDVPLSPWMVPMVLELKSTFDSGFSEEYTTMVGERTASDLTALIDAGRELSTAAASVDASIRAIGEFDVTFGIEGISRIIPAESALRDTLFGFVVWHEFSSAPAKGIMTRFESLVGHVVTAGPVVDEMADQLSSAQGRLAEAVDNRDATTTANLAGVIMETAERLDAVCKSVGVDAGHLMAVMDSLGADSGAELTAKWETAKQAAASSISPFAKADPATRSLSAAIHLIVEMGNIADRSARSVELTSVSPEADGNLYVSWTLLRNDYEMAAALEHLFLHEGGEDTGDAGAAQVGGHENGGEMGARLLDLLQLQVKANAMLAERAVEHASARSGFATDAIERQYMSLERYSNDMSQNDKTKALAKVDGRFRENMEYGVMRMSMRAARDELLKGRAEHALGVGHAEEALYHYQNAWLFCLNAGAAAKRAENEALNR
jgi:hypothetical protein